MSTVIVDPGSMTSADITCPDCSGYGEHFVGCLAAKATPGCRCADCDDRRTYEQVD